MATRKSPAPAKKAPAVKTPATKPAKKAVPKTKPTSTPAKKRSPAFSEDALPVTKRLRPGLRATDIPGVYRNRNGDLVDQSGVVLSFKELKLADDTRFAEVLDGEKVQTPAQLLKAVALDPRQPLGARIDAANKAAPYFDRKMPIGLEGSTPGAPIKMLSVGALKNLSSEELTSLAALLNKAEADDETQ